MSHPDQQTSPQTPDPCSAKGCQSPAEHALLWNNPRLHTPDRRKVWLACSAHRQNLSEFLGARSFLKDVVPYVPGQDPVSPTDR